MKSPDKEIIDLLQIIKPDDKARDKKQALAKRDDTTELQRIFCQV